MVQSGCIFQDSKVDFVLYAMLSVPKILPGVTIIHTHKCLTAFSEDAVPSLQRGVPLCRLEGIPIPLTNTRGKSDLAVDHRLSFKWLKKVGRMILLASQYTHTRTRTHTPLDHDSILMVDNLSFKVS